MKCPNCQAELTDDAKFCSYCGAKLGESIPKENEQHKQEEQVLPKWTVLSSDSELHSTINQNEEKRIPYVAPTVQSKEAKAPKTKGKEPKAVNNEKKEPKAINNEKKDTRVLGSKIDELKAAIAKNDKPQKSSAWQKLSIVEKVIIVFSLFVALALLTAVFAGKTVAVTITVIQIALLVVAFLLNKQIIRSSKRWMSWVAVGLVIILMIPFSSTFGAALIDNTNRLWADVVLNDYLPEPESHKGKIHTNTKNGLSMDIYNTSAKQYAKYIDSCKELGYTIDIEESDDSFEAYNSLGYKVSLIYSDSEKELSLNLDSPMELGTLTWSDSQLAKLLPIPNSDKGAIIADSNAVYSAYIGDTSIEEFEKYKEQCIEYGFTLKRTEDAKYYFAKNADGNKIEIRYEGNNIIYVSVYEPEFDITIDVKCIANWIFSKYDVEVLIDDSEKGILEHGTSDSYKAVLKKGIHTVKFVSIEDSSRNGEVTIEVSKDEKFEFEISCSSFGINVNSTSVSTALESKDESKTEKEKPSSKSNSSSSSQTSDDTEKGSVRYSTNDKSTVKNGNTGVYAYKKNGSPNLEGGWYDIYYIIDFDEGYVYYFCEGYGSEKEGNVTCDKVKIDSGTLNDAVIITYHVGSDVWSERLYFRWQNQPEHLIMCDANGFQYDFYATNLSDAKALRDKKEILLY